MQLHFSFIVHFSDLVKIPFLFLSGCGVLLIEHALHGCWLLLSSFLPSFHILFSLPCNTLGDVVLSLPTAAAAAIDPKVEEKSQEREGRVEKGKGDEEGA